MKAIGVRELKARLSQYLRDVRAGEVVLSHDPSVYRPSPLKAPPGTAKALLDAERGER